ncbi:hypothetical protein MNB_SM-7-1001 [hydrothermal vent metagenome]|uniref:Prepilin-type N-terminal cleavage/methylation domain-containing protein n=1 Tax=hydrothermal vent metagenome TaxID=652676 RepID=A0A1W1BKG9_9ZZZZ
MNKRGGFTLIEVMVAVMIISVVVIALLKLQSDNTTSFLHLQKMQKNLQYISLLQGTDYGVVNDSLTLDRTVVRFDLDDDLRQELKKIKAKILYQRLDKIDTKEFDDLFEEKEQTPLVIEIGRTVLKLPDGSASTLRITTP